MKTNTAACLIILSISLNSCSPNNSANKNQNDSFISIAVDARCHKIDSFRSTRYFVEDTMLINILRNFPINNIQNICYKRMPQKCENSLKRILENNKVIRVIDNSTETWDIGDAYLLTNYFIDCDSTTIILPGALLFQNENYFMITFYNGFEYNESKKFVGSIYTVNHGILCTISNKGEFINGVTVSMKNGNRHGFIKREFSLDKSLFLTIQEEGGFNFKDNKYNFIAKYKINEKGYINKISYNVKSGRHNLF